jgi:hypothetical protein
MKYALLVLPIAATLTTGCAQKGPAPATAATPTTSAVAATSPPQAPGAQGAVLPDKKSDQMLNQVGQMLAGSGMSCALDDPKTLVCDKDAPNKPTLVVLYFSSANVTRLAFGSAFAWKSPTACKEKATRINELNASTEFIKGFCNDEMMTWTATLVVPQSGLSEGDVRAFSGWFTASVRTLLAESHLLPLLR